MLVNATNQTNHCIIMYYHYYSSNKESKLQVLLGTSMSQPIKFEVHFVCLDCLRLYKRFVPQFSESHRPNKINQTHPFLSPGHQRLSQLCQFVPPWRPPPTTSLLRRHRVRSRYQLSRKASGTEAGRPGHAVSHETIAVAHHDAFLIDQLAHRHAWYRSV